MYPPRLSTQPDIDSRFIINSIPADGNGWWQPSAYKQTVLTVDGVLARRLVVA